MLFAFGFLLVALVFLGWGARSVWLAVGNPEQPGNAKRGVVGALFILLGLFFLMLSVLALLVALGMHAAGGLVGWYASTQTNWH